jgi:hypothetical protein
VYVSICRYMCVVLACQVYLLYLIVKVRATIAFVDVVVIPHACNGDPLDLVRLYSQFQRKNGLNQTKF